MPGETLPAQMSGTCKAALLAISAIVLLAVAALALAAVVDGFHEIPEGHVGVYYKFGALQEEISDPGIHYMQPFVTTFKSILIRPEEQTLRDMEAITKDGIEVEFKGISVLSRTRRSKVIYLIKEYGMDFKDVLIYNRIREDLRIFCANATIDDVYNEKFLDIVAKVKEDVEEQILNLGKDSVEILNLVIRKPDIPKDIAQNYKQVEIQWTEQLVAQQQKKTEEIKKETELLKAVADAERQKEVLEIKIQEQIIETEGKKNISDIFFLPSVSIICS